MRRKVVLYLVNCTIFCAAYQPQTFCPFAPRNILPDHAQNIGDLCKPPEIAACNPDTVYYTLDGSCNNLQFPSWGQANTPFARMVEANYADGECSLRRSANGLPLVPSRKIRTTLLTNQETSSPYFNIFYYAFGEYVNHDVSLQQPLKLTSKISCCDGLKPSESVDAKICLPTLIPQDDPFYSQYNVTCLEMTRSVNTNHQQCSVSPCLPINFQTAVLDLSTLYGTDESKLKELRFFKKGHLFYEEHYEMDDEIFPLETDDEIFPPRVRGEKFCPKGGIEPGAGNICMATGDYRMNRNPELTMIDIIFLRAHNHIADTLREYNSHWNDEKTFQEARRVLIALYQHITMAELVLPMIGTVTASSYGLLTPSKGFSATEYNPNVNTQTTIEYSFAAARSLHSMVKGEIGYLNMNGEQTSYKLRNSVYNLKFLLSRNVYTNLLSSYLQQSANQATEHFSEDLTNFSETLPGEKYGMDLIALDIDRGLDAGMPTYNTMRQACGLCRLNLFEDLDLEIRDPSVVPKLKSLYSDVDEIDFYVGGLLEKPVRGGIVGPTFACVIAENLFRWRTGDRLYFELPTAKFTLAQLDAIRNSTIAWLLCQSNQNLQFVPQHAFFMTSDNDNPIISCSDLHKLVDFSVFKDEK